MGVDEDRVAFGLKRSKNKTLNKHDSCDEEREPNINLRNLGPTNHHLIDLPSIVSVAPDSASDSSGSSHRCRSQTL